MSDSPFGPVPEVDADDAVKSFVAATEPDEPVIDVPRPGYVTLMHGIEVDGERVLSAEVRELNGADEEALSHFDPKDFGYAVTFTDATLRRAVTSLGGTKPDAAALSKLLIADRTLLFKEVMLATYGTSKEYEDVKCDKCEGGNDLTVDFDAALEVKPLEDDPEEVTATLRDGRVVTLHYPTGADQLAVFQSDKELTEAEANTAILARCISYIEGKPPANPVSFAKKLSVRDRRTLVKRLSQGPDVRFKEVEVPCVYCGNPMRFQLGWADLLLD